MKANLRKDVTSRLKRLEDPYIEQQSQRIFERLISSESYSKCSFLSIYLSMKKEVQTKAIVDDAFLKQKKIYIPKVTGKSSAQMLMVPVDSSEELKSFCKNKWGIPEPTTESIDNGQKVDGVYSRSIDCIIIPGVAFDRSCGRVGHGKGYYDCFLDRIQKDYDKVRKPYPQLIGLALDEQIVDKCPMEEFDVYLDYIITPTAVYNRGETL